MIVCLGTTPTVQRTMVFGTLRMDAVNRAQRVIETASGKSINVARVGTTLGVACAATGFVGGRSGEYIRGELGRAGVEHAFVDVGPATRTCVTVVEEERGISTELVEESAEVEPAAHERLLGTLRRLLVDRRVLVLSGSLTPGAPQDFYARCVAMANAAGVQTIVDGRGEPLERSLAHRPAVVKPNVGELGGTLGRELRTEAEVVAGARELIGRGARRVIVTRGAEPMLAVDEAAAYRVPGLGVRGKYPIGSGDSFAAGVAVAMARGEAFDSMLRLGMACGTANALVPIPGHLRVEDVRELEAQVGVKPI